MANKNPSPKTRFGSTGKNISGEIQAISVRFPPDIDAVLRSLPNRSDFIREAVIEKLKHEGMLDNNKEE